MRRPPPALALAAPVVEVDDVFITRLADLAAASVPSRVPVHPAALKVAAAATGVAVIAAGGAYAADQLTAPAPAHHVPPAGEPTTRSGPSPTSRNSDRTPVAPSGADGHARDLGGPGELAAPGTTPAGQGGKSHGHHQGAGHGQGQEHAGEHPNQGAEHGRDEGDEHGHGRKWHGTPPGNGQQNGQGPISGQGLGLGNDVVPDPPALGD